MGRLRSLKLINKTVFLMSLLLTVFFLTCLPVLAEQEGDFTYTISNGEATVTGYTGSSGDINIPNTLGAVSVTRIGDMAFQRTTSWPNTAYDIKSIHIPESVKSIGSYAFDCNMGLTSLNLPQGLTTIGNNAFQSLTSITTITIPEGVTKIEIETFCNCYGLVAVKIPESVQTIGEAAFRGCYSLKTINIPKGVTSINNNPFYSCENLTEITVDSNNLNYRSIDGILYDKTGSALIVWPCGNKNVVIPNFVTSIGDCAFACLDNLSNISIPEGVTRIGMAAFSGSNNLKEISLPKSISRIGDSAFMNCSSLTQIDIPEGITTINYQTFAYCTNLKNMEIPESVTSIGDYAFMSCSGLTVLDLPQGVTNIGTGAFTQCSSLTNINIPSGVTSIKDYTFSLCGRLAKIDLPTGITSINELAFANCAGLTSFTIPQGVTTIGKNAFQSCTGLTTISIPEKVQRIGLSAFTDCSNLKSIRINSPATVIDAFSYMWGETIPRQTTIISYDDSEAHKYADLYGNKFVVIGSEEDDATLGTIPQGMMMIVVKDCESKQPLAGATVNIKGQTIITDDKGGAVISGTEGQIGLLSMTCSSYCDYQTNLRFKGGTAEIYYLRKDTDPNSPHVSMINLNDGSSYYDLFKEEKDYNQIANDGDITDKDKSVIEMNANWKGKQPAKYLLTQDGKTIMESTTGIFEKKALGRLFKPRYKIYAVVEASDGTSSSPVEVNIQIISPVLQGDVMGTTNKDFYWNKKMVATIPSNLPVFGGKEVSYDIDKFPAMVQIEKDRFRIGIGVSEGLNTKENWDKFEKKYEDTTRKFNSLKDVTQAFSTKKLKMGMFATGKFTPEVDTIGYIEGVIENGQFIVTKGSVLVMADAKYMQQFQFVVGPVPIYAECGGGVKAEGTLQIIKYNPQTLGLITNTEFKVSLIGELGGGVGVANVITAGVNGRGDLSILTRPQDDYGKISLNGHMYLKATALFFEAKTEIAKGSWTIAEISGSKGIVEDNGVETFQAPFDLYDTTKYSLMPRDYAANPTEWSGGGGISTESTDYTNQTLKVLQTNIYPNAQPKITVVGDRQVMVWLADNPSRTSANRTMLVSSVYDKTTGTWSAPAAVADDGTADFYPQIGCDGTNLSVAWQNSKTTFGDEVALTDAAKAGEIAVAKFDAATGTFIGTTTLTSNDTLDTQPQVAVSGDKVGVVWTGNDQNDLFGTTGRNSLFIAQLSGGTWSAPQVVLTDQNAIPSLSAGYVNNTLTAAYTLDSDNDLNTIIDRDLYTLGAGQTANRITSDDVLDSNPVFAQFNGADTLFWYSDGNINYVPTASLSAAPATIFDQKKEGFSDAFTIVNNPAGKTAAIWTQTKDEVTEIYGSLYDNGTWSNDIRISDVGSRVQFPSGIFDTAGNFNIAFNRLTINADTSEQSDLCTLNVIPSYNLMMSDPYYEEAKIIPNTAMPVEIDVTNNGALKVDQIKVEVLDGTASNNTQILSESIQPGETRTITAQVNLPETITKKDYTIKVTPAAGDEYDLSDNQKTITLGYTDLALSVQKYNLGEAGGIVIKAQLENISYVPTDATLKITEDTLDGKVIFTKTHTGVKQGENQFVTFDLDPQTLAFTSDIKQIYVTVTASGEESSTGDNCDFIVLDNPANIAATLDSIAITTPATKLSYRIGEQLDLSGLVVTGIYSDGTTKVESVTTDNITGFDSSKAAKDQVLSITINGKTATYTVQIGDLSERQLGDVDGNGSITAYDALMALQIATNKKPGSEAEITAADVGKNGTVEAYDALKILQYATGKIKSF